MEPKISLIIPIYNAETYLRPCLDSVCKQTIFSDLQIILVDDGSKDNSPAICDAFAAEHDNVLVLHQENSGVSVARNNGIAAAKGEYIAFADADDLLMPPMLEKLYNACEETGADMALCGFIQPYPDRDEDVLYPFEENVLLNKEKIRTQIVDFMIREESCNALWNKIFRHSVIEDNQIRMTKGRKYGEDREFILRCLSVIDGACYVPYVGYYYRLVETGAIQKPRFDHGERILEQFKDDCEKFSVFGISPEEFESRAASCYAEKIAAAIYSIQSKFHGKTRRKVLESLVEDAPLQSLLGRIIDKAEGMSAYNEKMLRAMLGHNRFKMNLSFSLMNFKVKIYNLLKGQKG